MIVMGHVEFYLTCVKTSLRSLKQVPVGLKKSNNPMGTICQVHFSIYNEDVNNLHERYALNFDVLNNYY